MRSTFRMMFGPESFIRHRAQAEASGLATAVVRRPALGQDIDRPEDLIYLDRVAEFDAAFGTFWSALARRRMSEAV
jgi:2-phospho-L-lactate guanylyltransferase (CobY/MobA/RfbA family)